MLRLLSSLGAIALALVPATRGLAIAPQVPSPSPGIPPVQSAATAPKNGVILGRVVDAASGQPIPRTVVRISSAGGQLFTFGGPVAVTNPRGQFVFRGLQAGAFTLYAEAAGYLAGGYGQRRPEGPTRSVVVKDEITAEAEIRLWKAASISGTVFDESGPAVQITVTAFRREMVRGRIQLVPVATAVSDERGIYRVHSLVPGDYVIGMTTSITSIPLSASEAFWKAREQAQPGGVDPSQQRIVSDIVATQTTSAVGGVTIGDQQIYTYYNRPLAPAPGTDDRFMIYPTVFHPASLTPRGAGVITVATGEARQSVDLQIAMMRTLAVSGVATGPDGPLANVAVRLVPSFVDELGAETSFMTSMTSTNSQGRFTLVGVPPGSYVVSSVRGPANAMPVMMVNGTMTSSSFAGPTSSTPRDDTTLYAESTITVTDRDITSVALTSQTGFKISGRVEFVGSTPRPAAGRLAQSFMDVTRSDGRFLPFVSVATLSPNLTFASAQYPAGPYQLGFGLQAPGWYVKSITASGRDVLGRDVDLSRDLTDVVVTLVDHLPSLSGVVSRLGLASEVKATVAIIPADYEERVASGLTYFRSRLIAVAPSGAFETANLLPAQYLVAAIDPAVPVNLQDPKDLSALAGVATRITIEDADQKGVVAHHLSHPGERAPPHDSQRPSSCHVALGWCSSHGLQRICTNTTGQCVGATIRRGARQRLAVGADRDRRDSRTRHASRRRVGSGQARVHCS